MTYVVFLSQPITHSNLIVTLQATQEIWGPKIFHMQLCYDLDLDPSTFRTGWASASQHTASRQDSTSELL